MTLRSSILKRIKSLEKKFVVLNNIYVSKSAILHNFDLLSTLSPNGLVIPVLKSNAYGHGLEQITEILKSRNFPYIAVDGYYEALKIRSISKQPVLVMGYIDQSNYSKIKPKSYAFVVHDLISLNAIGKTNKKYTIHVEIETGMSRNGVRLDDLNNFLNQIKKYKRITLEGVMTHLADADNPDNTRHLQLQTERFDKAVETIIAKGFNPTYIHIAQSAGSTKVKSKYANTIRVGIALYGISPLDPTDPRSNKLKFLHPALTLTSKVTKLAKIDKGESVSYGCTFTAKQDSDIAVLPLGYYEGLPRVLSNVGKVKINNKYLPIAGRVCMNHTMIDTTGSDVKINDEVTIISSDQNDQLSIYNLCKDNKIFNYGLLVGLTQNIRRTIIE